MHPLGALISVIVNEISCASLYHYTHKKNTPVSYKIKILNIVLSMQSYKIYCQKSFLIVPDKRIKIIGTSSANLIYIFLQNLEWRFAHQTGDIQVRANKAEFLSLTFVDRNLREAE